MAGAGFESVTESERAKCGISARASAPNRKAVTVDVSVLDEISGAIDTVIDIYDAPLSLESFSIFTAVARAAAVIYIEYRDAPASPYSIAYLSDAELAEVGPPWLRRSEGVFCSPARRNPDSAADRNSHER